MIPPLTPPSLEDALARWRAQVEGDLKGASFEKRLVTRTPEGVAIQPLYAPPDLPDLPLGAPGAAPFLRGALSAPPEGEGWILAQRYDQPDPEALSEALMADLEGGVGAVSLRLRGGATADGGLPALMTATEGVDLSLIHLSLDAGAHGLAGACLLLALYEAKGVPPEARRGCLGVDPIGALARTGALPGDLPHALGALGRLGAHLKGSAPHLRIAQVDLAPFVNAGAGRVQTLALALSIGVAYLRALVDGGLSVEEALSRIAFSLPLGSRFLQDIALLRAFRGLWARVGEASGARPDALAADLEAEVSAHTLTRRDPWVNILRGTVGVFAGALGGATRILCPPYDAPLGEPGAGARRLARNTQLVLREESGLGRVLDPMGGSYFIESLTHDLEGRAWADFQALEAEGGAGAQLASGALGPALERAADARDALVRTRKRPITGVSEFPNLRERPPEVAPRPDAPWGPGSGGEGDALQAVSTASSAALALSMGIRAAARGASLVPLSAALGQAPAPVQRPLPHRPIAEAFEALRDRSDARTAATGARPSLFLATLGPAASHGARGTWITHLLEAGGIEARSPEETPEGAPLSVDALVAAFEASGSPGAVLCGADDAYTAEGAEVALALKQAGATPLLVAGRPGDLEIPLTEAGVTGFVYLGQDVVQRLQDLLVAQGAL